MRLSAVEVSVRHGNRSALERVSLSFEASEHALIVGPAGSGKTTLLKAFAGLLLPSEGAVIWDGVDLASLPRLERRRRQAAFGMVFQSDALFDSKSVLENVLLPLQRRRVPLPEARARASQALAEVDLLGAAERYPEHLSGGMKKRVGIARALVAGPEVLLADDPLAGLDPNTALEVAMVLRAVSHGRMLLVCAPDPVPGLELPRTIALRAGRVAADERAAPLEAAAP